MAACGPNNKMTQSLFLCGHEDELAQSDNYAGRLPAALYDFIDNAPCCEITSSRVSDIDWNAFERLKQEADAQRLKYDTDRAAWAAKLSEIRAEIERDKLDNQAKQEQFEIELRAANDAAKSAREESTRTREEAARDRERFTRSIDQLNADLARATAMANAAQQGGRRKRSVWQKLFW